MIPAPYQNQRPRATALVSLAALLSSCALAYRCRFFLGSGRIWAEDGTVFLPAMIENQTLWFVYHGHLEGWTNLVAWLASFVELEAAARVLTWLPLLVAMLVPVAAATLWRSGVLEVRALVVFLTLSSALPQVAEPLANAANLHFYAVYFTVRLAAPSSGLVVARGSRLRVRAQRSPRHSSPAGVRAGRLALP
ncbi:MAG: hypothetical protein JNJ54_37245 [Myxococcaceae bacterium]|nr:hypothetical protein [Myxococcaceae bacterium]